jgi:hypothetical protein
LSAGLEIQAGSSGSIFDSIRIGGYLSIIDSIVVRVASGSIQPVHFLGKLPSVWARPLRIRNPPTVLGSVPA